jgi:23S rRNA pseudouridine1911/1915/1917 synthase
MEAPVFRHETKVDESNAGRRLDTFLVKFPYEKFDPDFYPSRATIQKWIRDGHISVNGSPQTEKSYRLKNGDTISLEVPIPEDEPRPQPEALDIQIVYRDPYIVVIDKPPGISSHPVKNDLTGTVVNFLLHEEIPLARSQDPLRPGIVHRLDKNTSGLMVVASTREARSELIKMIQRRDVQRDYLALVYGNPPMDSGTIEGAISRHEGDRKKMAVTLDEKGKPARTHYRVLTRYPGFALVACRLDTGRTHQIRVHMSHIGYPVVGDPLYGGRHAKARIAKILKAMSKKERESYERILNEVTEIITRDNVHLLHAGRLSFPHPITGEKLTFTSRPHEKFEAVLSLLERLPHEDTGNAF